MESICIIANKYPNNIEPTALVFVQQLVWSLADLGITCKVICPLAVNINPEYFKVPYKTIEITEKGNKVEVFFPKYIGVGQAYKILKWRPAKFTTNSFTKAVLKVVKEFESLPYAFYGHFVTPAGIAAARIGKKYKKPSYLAYGESTTWSIDNFGKENVKQELSSLSGVISVSSRNKKMLIEQIEMEENKIKVFPNGYRAERFFRYDKSEARRKMGFPDDKFIVGFCGSFDERKGILRLEKAVEQLDNIYMVAAGKGKMVPSSSKCIFAQAVNNEDLPYFYSSLDIFVLPTRNEGCCNAIIEAMACGCPIISSDKSFNYDILDKSNAILIDPDNIDEIIKAIEMLKNNKELRESMIKNSLIKAEKLTLCERAKAISEYIFKEC